MKKIAYVGLGVMLLFGVASVNAATFAGGETYALGTGETVEGNLYTAGGSVDVAGTVDGDLLTAGGQISVTGNVTEDLFVAGGTLNLLGDVGEDLRVLGGNTIISGNIGGELVGAGGQISVLSGATVGGDLFLNGGSIKVDAPVGGDVQVNGGEVFLNGSVAGNVIVRSGGLHLGPDAVINGSLDYYSETEASIDESAVVLGERTFHEVEFGSKKVEKRGGLFGFLAGLALLRGLIVSAAALLFVYLWKRWADDLAVDGTKKFWKMTLYGFAALILTPVAAIILFVTALGIIPGMLLVLTYATGLVLASVFSGILTVALANKYLLKKPTADLLWWKVILGVFAFQLVKLIPFVGWFVTFVIFLASLGWFVNRVYGMLAKAKK